MTAMVHPRACGEHIKDHSKSYPGTGSSPRVRGTHQLIADVVAGWRFIPACAGNTAPRARRGSPSPVHPRVCGEHLAVDADPTVELRFIPACAGNTHRRSGAGQHRAVHPRVCGEHRMRVLCYGLWDGSSPRVRGTRCTSPRRGTASTVHPRVCGEHLDPSIKGRHPDGSSPRVRGTPAGQPPGRSLLRFIPACAGNTRSARCIGGSTTVHPRVCGEHPASVVPATGSVGSSPRVRGTPHHARRPGHDGRFIPACAGNTLAGC